MTDDRKPYIEIRVARWLTVWLAFLQDQPFAHFSHVWPNRINLWWRDGNEWKPLGSTPFHMHVRPADDEPPYGRLP